MGQWIDNIDKPKRDRLFSSFLSVYLSIYLSWISLWTFILLKCQERGRERERETLLCNCFLFFLSFSFSLKLFCLWVLWRGTSLGRSFHREDSRGGGEWSVHTLQLDVPLIDQLKRSINFSYRQAHVSLPLRIRREREKKTLNIFSFSSFFFFFIHLIDCSSTYRHPSV